MSWLVYLEEVAQNSSFVQDFVILSYTVTYIQYLLTARKYLLELNFFEMVQIFLN